MLGMRGEGNMAQRRLRAGNKSVLHIAKAGEGHTSSARIVLLRQRYHGAPQQKEGRVYGKHFFERATRNAL